MGRDRREGLALLVHLSVSLGLEHLIRDAYCAYASVGEHVGGGGGGEEVGGGLRRVLHGRTPKGLPQLARPRQPNALVIEAQPGTRRPAPPVPVPSCGEYKVGDADRMKAL